MAVPSNTYRPIAYGMRTPRATSGKVDAILRRAIGHSEADGRHDRPDLAAPPHSLVTLAALATSLHLFKSALMRSTNSAGEPLFASVASTRSFCRTAGS